MSFEEEDKVAKAIIAGLQKLTESEADRRMADKHIESIRDRLAAQISGRTQLSDELCEDISRLSPLQRLTLSNEPVLISHLGKDYSYPDPVYAAASFFRAGIATDLLRIGMMPSAELAKKMPEYCGQVVGDRHNVLLLAQAVNFMQLATLLTYSAMMNSLISPERAQADVMLDLCAEMKKLRDEPSALLIPVLFGAQNVMRDFSMFTKPQVLAYYSLTTSSPSELQTINLNAAGTFDLCAAVVERASLKPTQYGILAGSESQQFLKSLSESAPFLKRGLVTMAHQNDDGFSHGQLTRVETLRDLG
jgi:hypothetical protein